MKDVNAVLSVSMTTRAPREGEIEGESYYFVTLEKFAKTVNEGGLLEHAKVYNDCYGTPKEPVEKSLAEGKDVFLEIDTQGALQIKESYPSAVFIFILPPSLEELEHRIRNRGTESAADIEKRLSQVSGEVARLPKYDYCVVNDVLGDAVAKVETIISAEHSRVLPEYATEIISLFSSR